LPCLNSSGHCCCAGWYASMSSDHEFVATLICVGVASCSALASVLVWRFIESSALQTERTQTERPRRRAGQRSSWAWFARWPLSQLARPLAAHIPAGLRAAIGRMLERGDLDEILDAGQWLIAPLLAASAVALGCCLLSGARGMSLALEAIVAAAVAAIVQAEATGVSLVPVIRAQSMRGTQERFARAEKLAMEAPVKMLAPLVLCIFPCTFIVIGFPIAVRLLWGL